MANPVDFKEGNNLLLGGQDGVDDLMTWTDEATCVSCWELTWKERLSALFFGRAWISVLSGYTQPPIAVSVTREFFEEAE